MRERNNENIRKFKINYHMCSISILLIFLLAVFGKNVNYLAIPLLVFLVLSKFINVEYLFYAGLIFLPVTTVGIISVGFHLQLSQLFLFSSVLFAVLFQKFKFAIITCRFDVRIFTVILVLVVSSFQSVYLPSDPVVILGVFRNYPWIKSLSRILLICGLAILAFFIRAFFSNKELLKKFIKVFVFSSVFNSLIGILGFVLFFLGYSDIFGVSLVTHTVDELQRIKVFEYEPLFFGNYLLIIIPLMFSLLFTNKNNIISVRWLIVFNVINFVAIILTFSRGAWAGLLAVLLFFILINFKYIVNYFKKFMVLQNWRVLCVGVVSVVIILFFLVQSSFFYQYFIYPVSGAFDLNAGKFWSTKLRLMTVDIALSAFLSHPFLGIGFENFSFYAGNIFIYSLVDSVINYPDVGSLPIKILAEVGIFGFISIVYIFIVSFRDFLRLIGRSGDEFFKTVIKGCAGSVVGVMVQFLFFSNVFQLHLWVLLGLILAVANLSESANH